MHNNKIKKKCYYFEHGNVRFLNIYVLHTIQKYILFKPTYFLGKTKEI